MADIHDTYLPSQASTSCLVDLDQGMSFLIRSDVAICSRISHIDVVLSEPILNMEGLLHVSIYLVRHRVDKICMADGSQSSEQVRLFATDVCRVEAGHFTTQGADA